jgi:hypothetical protein
MPEFKTGTEVRTYSAEEGKEDEPENYVISPGMYSEYCVCTLYNLCRGHKYNNMTLLVWEVVKSDEEP